MNREEYTPFWGDLQRFITGRIEIYFYIGFSLYFNKLCDFGMADDCSSVLIKSGNELVDRSRDRYLDPLLRGDDRERAGIAVVWGRD